MPSVARALSREINIRRGLISALTYAVTYRCNMRCSMCGTWRHYGKDHPPELTLDELEPILRGARSLGASELRLVGAEPTMRDDLAAIIGRAKELDYAVHVMTNGTLISPRLAGDLAGAGLDHVTVSIDGPADVHDEVRGRSGVFSQAARGIANLLEARRNSRPGSLGVGIHCTITSTNADRLDEMPGVARDLGVDGLSFQLVSETTEDEVARSRIGNAPAAGREFVHEGGSLLPSLPQARRIREFARSASGRWFSNSLALLASMSPEDISRGRFPVVACRVMRGELIIDPYGIVTPCSGLGNYTLGDLRCETVVDVRDGDRRKKLIGAVGKNLLPVCAKCCHHPSNLTLFQKGMLYVGTRRPQAGHAGPAHT